MDSLQLRPVFFYHIPKTGGRFLFINTANIIKYDVIKRDIPIYKSLKCFGHRSFASVEYSNTMSISILREPVSRTVSHYLHIYENSATKNTKKDKKNFFKFLDENPKDGIINYQTKFISYNGNDEFIDIKNKNLPEEGDLSLSISRVSKIDYLLKSENLSFGVVNDILEKMYKNFLIPNPHKRVAVSYKSIINYESKALFTSLSKKEISRVEGMMTMDMDLYSSSKFYN